MGNFQHAIAYPKKGREFGPLRRIFSLEGWTERWEALRSDDEDDRLYKSGIWVWERWSALHEMRMKFEKNFPTGYPFRHKLLWWVNVETKNNIPSMDEIKELTPTTFQRSDISNQKNDDITVLFGDIIPLIFNHYADARCKAEQVWIDPLEWSAVGQLGIIHIKLAQLITIWEECLKLGFWIEVGETHTNIRSPNHQLLKSITIADDRRQSDTLCSHLFHRQYPELFWRSDDPPFPTIRSIEISDSGIDFRLETRISGDLPPGYGLRKIAEKYYPKPLLTAELPKYGLTVSDLLNVFECISSIIEPFLKGGIVHNAPSCTLIDGQLPILERDIFLKILKRSLLWPDDKVQRAINSLLYVPPCRDGAWSRPLLLSGNDNIYLSLPPLTSNPVRLVEHWLVDGGHSEHDRGQIYEQYAREEIKTALSKNDVLRNEAIVASHAVDIYVQGELRDIDICLRIGSTIFIIEFKGKLWPIAPWEIANYSDTMNEAAEQAAIRHDEINNQRRNKYIIAESTNYTGLIDDLVFIPFVLMHHQEGAGCVINGIPVIDLTSMCDYLSSSTYSMGYEFQNGEMRTTTTFKLYHSASDAAEKLPLFLNNQPRWLAREPLLVVNATHGRDPMPNSRDIIVHDRWDMVPYDSEKAAAACQAALAFWEAISRGQ